MSPWHQSTKPAADVQWAVLQAADTGATPGTTTGTRARMSPAHLAGWPTIALALISWIILLAGVAAVQKSCSNDDGFVAVGSVLPAVGCNRAYKYQWYACLHPCDRPVSQ